MKKILEYNTNHKKVVDAINKTYNSIPEPTPPTPPAKPIYYYKLTSNIGEESMEVYLVSSQDFDNISDFFEYVEGKNIPCCGYIYTEGCYYTAYIIRSVTEDECEVWANDPVAQTYRTFIMDVEYDNDIEKLGEV